MFKEEESKLPQIITIIAVIGALIVALAAVRDTASEQETISVSGMYETDVQPDQAEIFLMITTTDESSAEAQKQNKEISNTVIAALKSSGVDEDDIETISYTLQKRSHWDYEHSKEVDRGYEQQHTLKVTTKKLEDVGSIVDLAVENGVNNVQNIQFVLSDKRQAELKTDLLEHAAKNAKEKAEVLAKAVDRDIGKALTVSESSSFGGPWVYRGFEAKAESAAMEDVIIEPQDVHVQSTVNVVFELE